MQPHMIAGARRVLRLIDRNLAILRIVNHQCRQGHPQQLAARFEFRDATPVSRCTCASTIGLRARPKLKHSTEIGEQLWHRAWRRDGDHPIHRHRREPVNGADGGIDSHCAAE